MVTPTVTLRVLGPQDWPAWRDLRLAALAEAPHAFGSRLADWQGEGDREERWRARLELPGTHLLALLGDRPAGMASGVPLPPDPAASPPREPGAMELISLWVAPFARGRGVADRLIEDVVARADAAAAPALWLSVRETNAPAVTLYRRHGFEPTGERLPDLAHDGTTVHELVFRRALRPG